MIGALLGVVTPIVGKVLDRVLPEDPEKAREAKLEMVKMLEEGQSRELEAVAKVVMAEAQSDSWIARSWRPLTMLTFTAIIANNYILAPYLDAIFGWSVVLDLPDVMWELLKIGLGGYVVGRSAEKVAKAWKEK
jgi:hypothetical protein